jgi:osmoprotectant transport system permease protein
MHNYFSYLHDNASTIAGLLRAHTYLSVVPVILGLLIALPLGALADTKRWLKTPLLATAGALYSLPSLALLLLLPIILGTQILDSVNLIIALTIYTVALLLRGVIDGLGSVPDHVKLAAVGLGYSPLRRLLAVDLPIAVPVVTAGVRVATVANVSLVSIGSIIGLNGLGELFTRGFQTNDYNMIVTGIVLSVLLAFTLDAIIVVSQRLLTPWARAGAGAGR